MSFEASSNSLEGINIKFLAFPIPSLLKSQHFRANPLFIQESDSRGCQFRLNVMSRFPQRLSFVVRLTNNQRHPALSQLL
jgi:hypothetical protein